MSVEISFNPKEVERIVVSHDDVFGMGVYSIGIKIRHKKELVFHGDKVVLKIAEYLNEFMPEVSNKIKLIIKNDLLFNNVQTVYCGNMSRSSENWELPHDEVKNQSGEKN